MKTAFCKIDSTRDVVLAVYDTEERALKALHLAKRKAPSRSMPHVMYCVRDVTDTTEVGDRLHRVRK